jgi:hypothetical protein
VMSGHGGIFWLDIDRKSLCQLDDSSTKPIFDRSEKSCRSGAVGIVLVFAAF